MSVVLVCFPGAPKVSEEAVKKEEELDKYLEARVEGEPDSQPGLSELRFRGQTSFSLFTYLEQVLEQVHHNLTGVSLLCAELLGSSGEAGVPDLVSVLRSIGAENIPNLPPGGGLISK